MAMDEPLVAAENEAQAAAWDGDEGERWSANARFYDDAARLHHARLLAGAAIGAGERVLDLGCGNGQTTRDAARAAGPDGSAVGIDLSTKMIAQARRLADGEGVTNITFIHGDAQVYPFDAGSFDIAISRFGAMFFGDQVAAFANVRRTLRAGGRLAVMSWQAPAVNEWFTTMVDTLGLGRRLPPPPGTPGPFGHADPAAVSDVLAKAGFVDVEVESFEAPMYMGVDAEEGFEQISGVAGWLMDELDDGERAQALDGLRAALVAHQTPDGVALRGASWLFRATV